MVAAQAVRLGALMLCLLDVATHVYWFAVSRPEVRVERPSNFLTGWLLPGSGVKEDDTQNGSGSQADELAGAAGDKPASTLGEAVRPAVMPAGKTRLLCWVMTSPETLHTRGAAVNSTWLRRCNVQLFMSSKPDADPRVIQVVTEEGRENLPLKTMNAFKYLYDRYANDSDWFMKADDDTYVVVDNLKHMLNSLNPDNPLYLGHRFKAHIDQGYNSGGAGYVLSREALRRFGSSGYGRPAICGIATTDEDVELGRCMQNLGVRIGDTLDDSGRSRFHGYHPTNHLTGRMVEGYDYYDANGGRAGMSSVSSYAVTFHYITPEEMLVLEYFTHHFKRHGSST